MSLEEKMTWIGKLYIPSFGTPFNDFIFDVVRTRISYCELVDAFFFAKNLALSRSSSATLKKLMRLVDSVWALPSFQKTSHRPAHGSAIDANCRQYLEHARHCGSMTLDLDLPKARRYRRVACKCTLEKSTMLAVCLGICPGGFRFS